MREYTKINNAFLTQPNKTGIQYGACEEKANDFLQECNREKLSKLSDKDMAAHYFHMTPQSQWSPLGLATHKWALKKPTKKTPNFEKEQKKWKDMKPVTKNLMIYKK